MSAHDLLKKFPPSKPCSCDVCRDYCLRPGWWTVAEAEQAIDAGYAGRIMLELSPDFTFGVLSPAFRGNEGNIALQVFADCGCTFLRDGLCELIDSGFRPLECRFCHHARRDLGRKCHDAIEHDWNTREGQKLVIAWCDMNGIYQRYGIFVSPGKTTG